MSDEEWSDEDIYKSFCNDPSTNENITETCQEQTEKTGIKRSKINSSDSESSVPSIRLRKKPTRKRKRKIHNSSDSDSDSDMPLSKQFPNYKKFQSIQTSSDSSDYDDDVRDKDFDIRKEVAPSSDSNLSDIALCCPKRKKKQFTRKNQSVKRRKTVPTMHIKKQSKRTVQSLTKSVSQKIIAKYTGKGSSGYDKKLQQIKRKSKLENRFHQMILKSHKSRLSNLLHSNNLVKKKTPSNGDCFFNSISKLLPSQITGKDLRNT